MLTSEILNQFLFHELTKTFLSHIEAVSIPPDLTHWNSLMNMSNGRKITDVQLVLTEDLEIALHTTKILKFDAIKIFRIKYKYIIYRFWIDALPRYLEEFYVYASLDEYKTNDTLLLLVSDEFPNTLTHLHLEHTLYGLRNMKLPHLLTSLHLEYPDSYIDKPMFLPENAANIKHIFIKATNPTNGLSLGEGVCYLKLESLYLCCSKEATVFVYANNTPVLKKLTARRLRLINSENLRVKSKNYNFETSICQFEFY
jgi:hypothetical protein